MVFHLQFLHSHSAKQSVNCQSDLKHVIPSSKLGTSKQTVEANQLNSLERSLQAVTTPIREGPTVAAEIQLVLQATPSFVTIILIMLCS